jgi:RimJ/RimL family protein N-acetyltransferase
LLVQTVDGKEELEIAYSIMPEYWNQGYATEAAGKCRDFARENHLRDSLISIINVRNARSEKVAMHIGMTREKTTVYDGNTVNIFRIQFPSS